MTLKTGATFLLLPVLMERRMIFFLAEVMETRFGFPPAVTFLLTREDCRGALGDAVVDGLRLGTNKGS